MRLEIPSYSTAAATGRWNWWRCRRAFWIPCTCRRPSFEFFCLKDGRQAGLSGVAWAHDDFKTSAQGDQAAEDCRSRQVLEEACQGTGHRDRNLRLGQGLGLEGL